MSNSFVLISYIMRHILRQNFSLYFIWMAIALGILARVIQYMHNRSLWLDEAMLAMNVVERGFRELLLPLDYMQAAPVGFLIVTKLFVNMFGTSEYVLRILPFTAGVISIPLFYMLTRNILKHEAVNIAVILFALSQYAIYYSVEFKPYSIDVLAVIIMLILSIRLYQNNFKINDALLLGCAGVIAVWFSYAIIFVMTATGFTLLIVCLQTSNSIIKHKIISIVGIGGFWAVSFLINFLSFTKAAAHEELFLIWADRFAPFPPVSVSDLLWYPSTVFGLLGRPFGFSFTPVIAIIALAGIVAWWVENKKIFLFSFVGSIFILFALSAANLYPINYHLVLFLLPIGFIVVAEGLYQMYRNIRLQHIVIAFLFIAVIVYPPVKGGLKNVWSHQRREETRPLIHYLLDAKEESDIIYVYYGAVPAFKYYTRYQSVPFIRGEFNRRNPRGYYSELASIADTTSIWILFSHVYQDEEALIVEYLENKRTKAKYIRETGASLYRFNPIR